MGENSRRPQNAWNSRYIGRDEAPQEPAWMADLQSASAGQTNPVAADTGELDPLVRFVPGEDMIAAHKRAMKARDAEGDWRGGDRRLVSFFGADPVIASPSGSGGPPRGLPSSSMKARVFNAADYLRPKKSQGDEEEEKEMEQPDPTANAFQSRFQRFFGTGPSFVPVEPSGSDLPSSALPNEHQAESPFVRSPRKLLSPNKSDVDGDAGPRSDDHFATLMGLLSSEVSSVFSMFRRPMPSFRNDQIPLPAHQILMTTDSRIPKSIFRRICPTCE